MSEIFKDTKYTTHPVNATCSAAEELFEREVVSIYKLNNRYQELTIDY